jgi:hypothetical protein
LPSVWLLNLDADHELARPLGYAPTDAVRARVESLREQVRADLFEAGDIELVPGSSSPTEVRGLPGRAWCMTPRARRLLAEAGAIPVEVPPLDVLQRVNARSFAHALQPANGQSICTDATDELVRFLDAAEAETQWLAKRAHGMAGRGQRRLAAGPLSRADAQWLAKSCAAGSVLIERRRELVLECIVHGELAADGELYLGPVLEQRCDAQGAWIENRASPPIDQEELRLLTDAAVLAARALSTVGYFGPFGLDSYAWLEGGERRWNPFSDLNARFTMGWRRDGLRRHLD